MGGLDLRAWCLLIGLVVGGGLGWLTRPQVVEIKVGNKSVELSANNKVSAKPFEHINGDELHELTLAAFGGILGLMTGFIVEQRRRPQEKQNG